MDATAGIENAPSLALADTGPVVTAQPPAGMVVALLEVPGSGMVRPRVRARVDGKDVAWSVDAAWTCSCGVDTSLRAVVTCAHIELVAALLGREASERLILARQAAGYGYQGGAKGPRRFKL